jgi:DNA-binding transcriptional LysR family regulator
VEPLILIDLPFSREYFLSLFAHVGLTPQVRHRSGNLELIHGLVANGFGYTIIAAQPAVRRALDGREFIAVPIVGDPAPARLGLLFLKGTRHPGAVLAFHDFCKRSAAEGGLGGLHVGTPADDLLVPEPVAD